MAEVIGDSSVAGNEDSLLDTSTGPDPTDCFFDFDSYLSNDCPDTRPIHQNPDPPEAVSSFESLSERNDSARSETPDIYRSEPLPTGPSAPNFLFQPEHTTLLEPIASIDNRTQPRFVGIEIWDPSRELKGVDAEKEYNKTTKRHTLPPKAPHKKAKIDEANRKRARHGTTCVRCKLQKLRAC